MARILFIAERFPPDIGGLAASGARIAKSLVKLGHQVDVVAWTRHLDGGRMQQMEPDTAGLRVFRVGMYKEWDATMPATMNIVDWLTADQAYDLIWGHYIFPAGFFATWLGSLLGICSTVSARGNDLDRELFPPGDFSRLLWTLQRATTITAVSRDMARKIETVCGRNDIQILHNAVDTELFASGDFAVPGAGGTPALPGAVESAHADSGLSEHGLAGLSEDGPAGLREKLGISPDELVLGFCGELREKKGMPFLLSALEEVRRVRPACLLVIGEVRAQQKAALQVFAMEYPESAKRIIMTNHMEDICSVAEHLRLCDIYLQPSLFEGMPNALLEAMACGSLCIASDAGGIPEIIEHGVNGFMLPRAQLNHLGTAIHEALDLSETQREEIRKNARKTVLEKFSLSRESQDLKATLDSLFNKSSKHAIS